MRIAVIGAKGLPAHQGGIEHHCQELYSRIVQQGHQVDLYARSSYTRSLSHTTVKGVRVISLPSVSFEGLDALSCSLLGTLSTVSGFQQSAYDIVHFHALGPSVFCRLAQGRARTVVTCHGLDWARAKWGKSTRWLLQQGEHMAVKYANALIVVSEDLQVYFQTTYSKSTVYIPNAPARYVASDAAFQFGRSLGLTPQRYVLFLGRLVPEKRPDLLLDAFQGLAESEWKLVLVGGDGGSPGYVQQLQQQYLPSDRVQFTGELSGARLAEIVRGAGLLVLPSALEGMPLVLLEAMNEGVPVLASDLSIHRRLTADGRGLLFREGSVESCRQQVRWAMAHPHALRTMAATAQHYIQATYDWEHIAQQTIAVYQQVLTRGATHTPRPQMSSVKL